MTKHTLNIKDEEYRIELELFEGPLDLLLYLIKRDEIDIYDIPIAHVATQFVGFVEKAKELNLNIAGEYLLLASMLIKIKVATMLPKSSKLDMREIEDPRDELVSLLLEFTRYRKMGEALAKRYSNEKKHYPRGYIDLTTKQNVLPLVEVNLSSLMQIAWDLLKEKDKFIYAPTKTERISIEDQAIFVLKKISNKGRMRFVELFEDQVSLAILVVTFAACLELVKKGRLSLRQREAFAPLWLYRKEFTETPNDTDEDNTDTDISLENFDTTTLN